MTHDVVEKILTSAFMLAADDGWHGMNLANIADHSGMPLAEIYRYAPTVASIPVLLARHADALVLAAGPGIEPSVRDNLFDLLMRRFDALVPYRAGMRALMRPHPRGGVALVAGGAQLLVSMGLMLGAAGDNAHDASRPVRQAALAGLWLRVMRVWFGDESADLARTMATLDRDLNTAEMLANSVAEGPMALVGALAGAVRRRRPPDAEM